MVIDGGLSRAYQEQTGIAGYTLLFNSHGLLLSEHEAFESVKKAITDDDDIHSSLYTVELAPHRLLVKDTDKGKALKKKIEDLHALVRALREGVIK